MTKCEFDESAQKKQESQETEGLMEYHRKPGYYTPLEVKMQRLVDTKHRLRVGLGLALGHLAHSVGTSSAAQRMGVSRRVAQYWRDKVSDPTLHAGTWGGRREENMRFGSLKGDLSAQLVVFAAICAYPRLSFYGLLQKVRTVPGMENVSARWLSQTLKCWDWTWRQVTRFARQKFTAPNMERYINYCERIIDVPFERVRWLVY